MSSGQGRGGNRGQGTKPIQKGPRKLPWDRDGMVINSMIPIKISPFHKFYYPSPFLTSYKSLIQQWLIGAKLSGGAFWAGIRGLFEVKILIKNNLVSQFNPFGCPFSSPFRCLRGWNSELLVRNWGKFRGFSGNYFWLIFAKSEKRA